ncbi:MAG: hypothetical protein MI796_18715 [Enterobacterales bacterium]|nr:hypothetical protein [Enterobacterales bacterium]|tara:strand:- start:324 stop:1124 length:801 start_codon:yes stop_codon:yes gene_type:complete
MKEVFTAINDRIKTPYYGYALLAFFALNWRAIFVLFVSKGNAVERLAAFDSNTSSIKLIVLPLIIGLFISLINPWLKVLFSWIEKKPRQLYSDSISDEEHSKLKYQIKLKLERDALQSAEEEALINKAKRDVDIENIQDEKVKEKLKSDIKEKRKDYELNSRELLNSLTEAELNILETIIQRESGTVTDDYKTFKIAEKTFGKGNSRDELYARAQSALDLLITKGLMDQSSDTFPVEFKLNGKGWDLIDTIRADHKNQKDYLEHDF